MSFDRKTQQIELTPTLDTSAYASGDAMGDLQTIDLLNGPMEGSGIVISASIIDKDEQSLGFDIVFFKGAVTAQSDNAAVAFTDADAAKYLGHITVESGDYIDIGGSTVANKQSVGLHIKKDEADLDGKVYVQLISRGAPTHTASGLIIKISAVID